MQPVLPVGAGKLATGSAMLCSPAGEIRQSRKIER